MSKPLYTPSLWNMACECRFFESVETYNHEISFYEREVFRACLPRLDYNTPNADRACTSQSGFVFPPFIVLDRGNTLYWWLQRPRSAGAVLVMAGEVLELLCKLHASGHVHRDIKPANLLFVHNSASWRLLDFGIVARAGAFLRTCSNPSS